MNINTTYTKIITGEDLMETAQHGSTLYPFQFYYEDLSVFDFNCIEWHWHTEFGGLFILNPEPLLCGLENTNFI